jgi:hypothetical protein
MNKKIKIEVQEHWGHELAKLRSWMSGFRAGRTLPGQVNLEAYIPGEDIIRQILLAISDTKIK